MKTLSLIAREMGLFENEKQNYPSGLTLGNNVALQRELTFPGFCKLNCHSKCFAKFQTGLHLGSVGGG